MPVDRKVIIDALIGFGATLADLLIEVTPYFLLGVWFGALLTVYVKPSWTNRFLARGTASVFYASLLGALLPGCSCATMPMAEGLKAQGARLGTVTAFIVISPLLSPVTLLLTYGLLGGKMTVARLLVPFVFSVTVGVLLNALERVRVRGFALPRPAPGGLRGTAVAAACDARSEYGGLRATLWQILRSLTPYFLLGITLAALLMTLVPPQTIPRYLGASGPTAYVLAALVGIPMYVCEGEELPLTYALRQLGLGVGPAFTFLLGSVGTCIPTMLMARRIIGDAATLLYIVSWFVFAILSGWLVALWY